MPPPPCWNSRRLIEEAGFPPGVFNVVTGHGEPCGRVLTSHPLVQRISFTGGPQSARHIIRNSAENLAQVSLELGGKSPFIVFEDADLESAVNGVDRRHLRRHGASPASRARGSICRRRWPTSSSTRMVGRAQGRSASAIRCRRRRRWARSPRRGSWTGSRGKWPSRRNRAAGCSPAASARRRRTAACIYEPTIVDCPEPVGRASSTPNSSARC